VHIVTGLAIRWVRGSLKECLVAGGSRGTCIQEPHRVLRDEHLSRSVLDVRVPALVYIDAQPDVELPPAVQFAFCCESVCL
jgi:hypothetical protein